jgi:hypothetical protein
MNSTAEAITRMKRFNIVFSLLEDLWRDTFMNASVRGKVLRIVELPEFVTAMVLKSALQDLRETTLSAVNGLLGKLAYLGSLREREGSYGHWGMSLVHGDESSQRALKAAHVEVVTDILRAPIENLVEDLQKSSATESVSSGAYIERLREHFEQLLPNVPQDSAAAKHLNSVLVALSCIQQNRERATRSVS